MKILFLGSSRFSKIVLNKMIESGLDVVAVITQPDRPSGRGHKLTPTEVKSYALEKGIEVLDNETGFFMMCEGGKIDWACHANDAATTIHDVLAFSEAVQVAIEFAEEHAEETLILVTGDHETGGLSIGYAETNYDTYLTNFNHQKISFQSF